MDSEQWLELLPTHLREGSGPRQALDSTCRPRLARTRRGKVNGSVTRVTKPFLRGKRPPGRVKEVIQKLIAAQQLSGSPVALHWL